MKKMEDIVEVLERIPGGPYAKKIKCKLCGDIVFDVRRDCTRKELDLEMVRLTAHMMIQHQIEVEHCKCDDPNCVD